MASKMNHQYDLFASLYHSFQGNVKYTLFIFYNETSFMLPILNNTVQLQELYCIVL